MKIGDKVRFLSEVGGGVVAGFQGKNIVLVEDEDGFQIPTSITDVVVIDNDDYNIKPEVQTPSTVKDDDEDYDPADRPITFTAEPEERKGGDALSVYLGFVPVDIKEITNTKFEVYLINDSNYYIDFTYLTVEGTSWNLRSRGTVEPNTKLFIEEFGREVLNELERVAVQFVAYKKDKGFLLKPTVDTQLRIDTVKFYKLHTFQENDFFEQAALIYTLIENDKPVRPLVVDAKKLKIEMARKVSADNKSKTIVQHARKKAKDEPVVVDLHASEILDTIAGMSPADILNYQLDLFKKTMDSYMGKHGTKIVFIHGKGEGVLRHAIIHELNYRYKNCPYQDASFQEYGYGATQVTIK
ncbi:dNA mismatch repair protein [Prevotella sp. CAG:1185]|uniref:DUF2027 domain-containing protein n=1 Tax=uncultured Prevotella sp. TaxID=159272 RepID=UPI000335380D|nr:DUF2027 domain-containing protein [uncultured Prevotella sp.]CCY83618.1 dNA mismatch repair protein [Prevotella sp. CAG:1185]